MSNLFIDLLDAKRQTVWKQLKNVSPKGILAGGTALALQIGHRISYDFDIFFEKQIAKTELIHLKKLFPKDLMSVSVDTPDELSVILKPDIKLTLLHYPFAPLHTGIKTDSLKLYDIRDIGSSKAYTIGRRGAFRDYVDIYFLLQQGFSLANIVREAEKRFNGAFNAKLFLEQLEYLGDIHDFSVEYAKEKISQQEIEGTLKKEVKSYIEKTLG